MTPREQSEQSLEALTAQIEAWRAAHPGESIHAEPPSIPARTAFDIALGFTRHAVYPTHTIVPPQNVQPLRNLFARLAWQEWWRTARIFGFRSTAVQTFRSPV